MDLAERENCIKLEATTVCFTLQSTPNWPSVVRFQDFNQRTKRLGLARKTSSRPGRSAASLTSSSSKPVADKESTTSSGWRKRNVESEVSTAPSEPNTNVQRNDTSSPRRSITSTQDSTSPTPGTLMHAWDRSEVQSSHARRSGLRV